MLRGLSGLLLRVLNLELEIWSRGLRQSLRTSKPRTLRRRLPKGVVEKIVATDKASRRVVRHQER